MSNRRRVTPAKRRLNKKISNSIRKIVHGWQRKGTIGYSKPRSKKQAIKQAVAIAYRKAGVARKSPAKRRTARRK